MSKRTTYCGLVTESLLDQEVTLKGWVHNRRDLGGLIFVDLRDREGYVQIVFNPDFSEEALKTAETVRSEYVVEVKGLVKKRDPQTVNPKIATGQVEVQVSEINIINKSETPPFAINEENQNVDENIRLKYRYLDLRRQELAQTFKMRHQTTRSIRQYLDKEGFFDIETPVLTKSTPEGARDYLVPSRVHDGEFYALPQSPQIFKQLLMISGFDKYYQIVKCFRDEDLRADRQPEFTQVDIEMSFVDQEDVMDMGEEMLQNVVKDVKDVEIPRPFPRMTYNEAMERYGSDKPDTRFEMELINVSELGEEMDFKVFKDAVNNDGQVKAIVAKGAADQYTRKDIDALTEFVNIYGAKGLAWVKVVDDGLSGPIARFFETTHIEKLQSLTNAESGDLVLFVADKPNVVAQSLGALRLKLARELDLIDESKLNFLWVTDWPLLEYDEDLKRYTAAHHPFTAPKQEDIEKLDSEPENAQANAYDVVLNGYELGGGSIRIHNGELQAKMFEVLGFTEEQAQEQFGFLLDAFKYGAPPHGGIALGLDRLVMLLTGRTNLRDTIAFPKTASATCLLTDAPSEVSENQLEELSLRIRH
ncbi:aspartyl-tRNA synthetase [Staphylococcus saprophyticus]|jgi:aspartyl-tRNA synthetase|uniref:Aspartate--tRNA ligase n=3 Tax=Staphylococcaceae TaxID=90964 RepID=SYD_STAS1|nr:MULTISPECIES: aspartate--tRNA ligase [Staphylococcus]Q49Y68.1 RecName: Full=Aspartate--tRNA ligase; AltName: Full=Aspartyl-tRNA synthetase; Short=AspRS [Staphylococcus saprophyticus subsp. saprophyticus ATCC 15305 = NCTC 7292]CRV16842.1 aspartyl-tRNA synthetase [Streptococcus equi subsp. equi]AMG20240.1 aspartate--tRNA ligase [Staphylococcus saprophyticus]AMG33300.1 aspartate--tRNA ligase [Staphylococcus saprophyticus]ASE59220.1 aspartate--tRNA ligase [Staphylococcus saprophyticus]ASF17989